MPDPGFFDVREKLLPPRRGGTGGAPALASASVGPPGSLKPMSVTELTRLVDNALRSKLPANVLVKGELSNFSHHRGSGHAYFTLKDAGACVNCVMFKTAFAAVPFDVTDGMELLAGGNVRVYAPQGRHQLYVESLQPLGRGALELALQQRRTKLAAEGLFDADRKKPIPPYPATIALLTSRETAALQDMLKVLRRVPTLRLMLYHVPVQGQTCGPTIAAALARLNTAAESVGGIDLVLLGRGGGSLEDLWGFNDEALVRAIAASRLPVITGIGHEVDVSLADLAADHWAHTPTEAATHAIAHWRAAPVLLEGIERRLDRSIRAQLSDGKQRLAAVERHEMLRRPTHGVDRLRMLIDDRERSLLLGINHLLRQHEVRLRQAGTRLQRHSPAALLGGAHARLLQIEQRLSRAAAHLLRGRRDRLDQYAAELTQHHPRHALRLHAARVDVAADRLRRGTTQAIKDRSAALASLSARLEALSPTAVLSRGYSITTVKKTGQIVRADADVRAGQRLLTRLADGVIESTAEDSSQPLLFGAP